MQTSLLLEGVPRDKHPIQKTHLFVALLTKVVLYLCYLVQLKPERFVRTTISKL